MLTWNYFSSRKWILNLSKSTIMQWNLTREIMYCNTGFFKAFLQVFCEFAMISHYELKTLHYQEVIIASSWVPVMLCLSWRENLHS